MSPASELKNDFEAVEMSNVTATNVSTDPINRIVINTLDELLSTYGAETVGHYLLVAIIIYLLVFSTVGVLSALISV